MLTRISRLFYGWRMIAVGSALRVLGGGLYYYGFSVFFLPLSQDLGLNRAATSLVFSLARAQGALEGPVAGYFMDRYGPRPLMLMAICLTGIGHMILSNVHSYAMLIVVYMGLVSLSFHAGFMDAPMLIANTWFIRRRTIAMAIISGSVGLGGFLLTPMLSQAIHAWGWRRAAIANGVAFIVLGLPLASLVRRSPESMGLRPDGDPPHPPAGRGAHANIEVEEASATLRAAMRTSAFWFLTIGTLLRIVALSAVNVHYVPIMVWKGMTEQTAAVMLGAQAFLGLLSHMFIGWIADRFDKARLMAICMVISASALLFLIYGKTQWQIWMFLPLFTVVESTFPVNWSAVGDFFGRRHFAKIRGTMSFVQTWGAVAGPVIAGATYDRTHSYAHLLWGLIGVLLVTALLYALVVNPTMRAERLRAES
jgi:MFS family permease